MPALISQLSTAESSAGSFVSWASFAVAAIGTANLRCSSTVLTDGPFSGVAVMRGFEDSRSCCFHTITTIARYCSCCETWHLLLHAVVTRISHSSRSLAPSDGKPCTPRDACLPAQPRDRSGEQYLKLGWRCVSHISWSPHRNHISCYCWLH